MRIWHVLEKGALWYSHSWWVVRQVGDWPGGHRGSGSHIRGVGPAGCAEVDARGSCHYLGHHIGLLIDQGQHGNDFDLV
ncbi:hypothetical protein PGB90_000009 [Kerria lacca]